MPNRLTALFTKWRPDAGAPDKYFSPRLRPDQPFFAVGDIHGCAGHLTRLCDRFDQAARGGEACVFLGDYIDRGPQTREVLLQLYAMSRAIPEKVICLKGNHEQMLLDFIDDPARAGGDWLQSGGAATLASFGISPDQRPLEMEAWLDLADQLEAAMPAGLHDWLRNLPARWSTGNMHCVHAAMSPKRPPEHQKPEVLLWGHPKFLKAEREDDAIVVHGHTIVKKAHLTGSRIALDTGAYRSGRLSAAHITPGACRFIEVQ